MHLHHPTETEDDSVRQRSVKEAIIDLYLAIKIRSTEELDAINDGNLKDEKSKLLEQMDSFQILEYIRSSIEIIMNLKIEDLERNEGGGGPSKATTGRKKEKVGEVEDKSETETNFSRISIESKNLIQ